MLCEVSPINSVPRDPFISKHHQRLRCRISGSLLLNSNMPTCDAKLPRRPCRRQFLVAYYAKPRSSAVRHAKIKTRNTGAIA